MSESVITNLTTDLSACEKTAHKNVAGGYCELDSNTLVPVVCIPNIPESTVTNLTSDLSACEKIANKGIQNGYAPTNSYDQVGTQYIDTSYF